MVFQVEFAAKSQKELTVTSGDEFYMKLTVRVDAKDAEEAIRIAKDKAAPHVNHMVVVRVEEYTIFMVR